MRLNCLLFAAALWVRSRFRSGIGVKRSQGLAGLVPHFFHVRERGQGLVVEDYIHDKPLKTALLLANTILCWALALTGVYAVARIAFSA